jgi:hypothetical protein
MGYIYLLRFLMLHVDCPAWLDLAVIRASPFNDRRAGQMHRISRGMETRSGAIDRL